MPLNTSKWDTRNREREKEEWEYTKRQDLFDESSIPSYQYINIWTMMISILGSAVWNLHLNPNNLFKGGLSSLNPPFCVLHAVLVGRKRWLKQLVHKNVCDTQREGNGVGEIFRLDICWWIMIEMWDAQRFGWGYELFFWNFELSPNSSYTEWNDGMLCLTCDLMFASLMIWCISLNA